MSSLSPLSSSYAPDRVCGWRRTGRWARGAKLALFYFGSPHPGGRHRPVDVWLPGAEEVQAGPVDEENAARHGGDEWSRAWRLQLGPCLDR